MVLDTAAKKPEIYIRPKLERLWMRRMKALPNGAFDTAVERILRGDSKLSICRYLYSIEPKYSFNTYRNYLDVLARDVLGELEARRVAEENMRATSIAEYNRKKAAGEPIPPPEPPPAAGSVERLKQTVSRAMRNLDAEQELKYAWMLQQEHMDDLRDMQKRMGGITLPGWCENIVALTRIAEATMKHEMGSALMTRRTGDNIDLDISTFTPEGKEIAGMNAVERNLVRQFLERVTEAAHDPAAQELGTDSGGTPDAEGK